MTRRLRDVGIEPCLSFLSLLVVPIILILIFCIYRSKDLMTEERFNRVRRIRILIPILVIANILLLIVFLPGFLIVGSLFYDIVIVICAYKWCLFGNCSFNKFGRGRFGK